MGSTIGAVALGEYYSDDVDSDVGLAATAESRCLEIEIRIEGGSVTSRQITSSWRELRAGTSDRGGVHLTAFYAAQSVLYSGGHRAL